MTAVTMRFVRAKKKKNCHHLKSAIFLPILQLFTTLRWIRV